MHRARARAHHCPRMLTRRPVHVSQPASVIAVGDKVEIKTATKDCDESVTA